MSLVGCVQRRLTITSEPSGALVYLNDQEAGRTPFTTDIRWYGDHDVVVRKDGYDTLVTHANVKAPWWQYPPIDLVAEIMPWQPTDQQSLHFALTPHPAETPGSIIERGLEMKRELPATQPAR